MGVKEMINCRSRGDKLQPIDCIRMVIIIQQCISVGQDKMNKINSFSVEPISMMSLNFHSQEDLDKSLTFSARSTKEHSISQTNCSHLSASKIVTDSEQEQDQEQAEEDQLCQSFHLEGSCQAGRNCRLSHNRLKARSLGLSKRILLENFPQLVTLGIQRAHSFLE